MSAVKHQPATPLPWGAGTPEACGGDAEYARLIICGPDGSSIGQMTLGFTEEEADDKIEPQNADYAIHVANAYPKLIEALRKVLHFAEMERQGDESPVERDARALLIDLGESNG